MTEAKALWTTGQQFVGEARVDMRLSSMATRNPALARWNWC